LIKNIRLCNSGKSQINLVSADVWEKYYYRLLVEDCKEFLDKDERLLKKSKGNIIEIDSNTIKQAIMRMKNGRAAGPGDIPIELIKSTVYVLLGISPASTCDMPTFRNHVSVPSSKAGSRLCGVRKGKGIYTVAGNGTGAGQANGKVRHR